jgi:hypothetical protein
LKKITAEQQERMLLAIVLLIGMLLMLIAGQFALQMPSTWQISDINMDSKLDPNQVYALYRAEYDLRLAPIRTDIPNLLVTVTAASQNPDSVLPPLAVQFNAPVQIATTTPFRNASPTAAVTATQTASASLTVLATSSETPMPTSTPSQTFLPTSTARRTATRTATRTTTRTATSTTTAALTNTAALSATTVPTGTLLPSATQTRTSTMTPSSTASNTPTASPTRTATAIVTLTPEPPATLSPTTEPGPTTAVPATAAPTSCIITGSNNYTIPIGGCTATYDTSAQGAIFSINMIGSGNLSVSWFGLGQNQTSGTCAAQSAHLTPGISINNIAVTKTTTTAVTFTNANDKLIEVQITVADWLVGGCQ